MRIRSAVTMALLAGLAVAPHAGAAPKPIKPLKTVVTDTKGDANAINNQGLPLPIPGNNAGPAGFPGMDIQSITFESVWAGRTPTSLKVTMLLDSAPTFPSVVYRVTGSVGGCATLSITYEVSPAGSSAIIRSCAAALPGYVDTPISSPKIDGNKIVFTIPYKTFEKSLPETKAKLGAIFSDIGGHIRTVLVAATVPVIDDVASTQMFKFGT